MKVHDMLVLRLVGVLPEFLNHQKAQWEHEQAFLLKPAKLRHLNEPIQRNRKFFFLKKKPFKYIGYSKRGSDNLLNEKCKIM